jgi:pimeloyl-ACP methyl ester carboxylesterase
MGFMGGCTHRYAQVNGIRMHYVEQGEGPLVVLCHGFPHLWFSWRHQIPAIADAGWRVVAPDMRGMGQSDAPAQPACYDVEHTTGDLSGLLDHLGEQAAVFIGLDFGVFAIYDLAFRSPERLRAIVGLENPVTPHNPQLPPLREAESWAKNHFVHIHYFEPPGPADAALNAQPREFLTKVFYALSGDYHYLDVWKHPPGTSYLDALPQPPPLPWRWLSEAEMEFFVSEYARTGFTGGLNWYRAMDLRWAQRRRFEGMRNPVPFYFIGSERDCDLEAWHGDDPLGALQQQYREVRGVAMLSEAGHMMQMERPREVNEWILRFLAELR